MAELERCRTLAEQAAREAGRLILDALREGKRQVGHKEGKSYNFVTDADLRSEDLIVSLIRQEFPDHAILAEEQGASEQQSEYLWVIDPLDATNNYAHGFPMFAVSVALYQQEQPLLGVVFDPTRDELFFAQRDQGAFLNGVRIMVSGAGTLPESILATGFYYERGALMRRTLGQIERFFEANVVGIRRTGSACLDLCYVACGRLDGFWELKLGPWDYAAGALIISEAGGRIGDVAGHPFSLFMRNALASNGKIHAEMVRILGGG